MFVFRDELEVTRTLVIDIGMPFLQLQPKELMLQSEYFVKIINFACYAAG